MIWVGVSKEDGLTRMGINTRSFQSGMKILSSLSLSKGGRTYMDRYDKYAVFLMGFKKQAPHIHRDASSICPWRVVSMSSMGGTEVT